MVTLVLKFSCFCIVKSDLSGAMQTVFYLDIDTEFLIHYLFWPHLSCLQWDSSHTENKILKNLIAKPHFSLEQMKDNGMLQNYFSCLFTFSGQVPH